MVFLDESGFLLAPLVRRSWAPRGVTPVLYQRGRAHQKVSALAALVVPPERDTVACYFRLHQNANLDAGRVLAFLRHLTRELDGVPFFLIWDRLQLHRAAAIRALFHALTPSRIVFFPAYAPELNPVEYLWSYLKTNSLANFTPADAPSLATTTRRSARSLQRTPTLLRSFIKHSPLSLCLH